MTENILVDVGLVVIAAIVGGTICAKLRQSTALGYILAGFILGPAVLHVLVPDQGIATIFGEVGIVMIMFYLGLELNLRKFLETASVSLVLAAAQMGLSFAAGYVVGKAFGFGDIESVVLGAMIVASSTAIIARFLLEKGIINSLESRLALSILMLQDFFAIFMLVFLSGVGTQRSFNSVVLTALFFMVAMFFVVSKVSRHVLNFLQSLDHGNKMVFYAIGIGGLVAWIGDVLGLGTTLGAYFAGFALAETHYGERIKKDLGFFREFFILFFFVSFGATLFYNADLGKAVIPSLQVLAPLAGVAAVLVLVHVAVLVLALFLIGLLMGIDKYTAGNVAMLLVPLGEFVIIIASGAKPLLGQGAFDAIATVSFLLILFSSPIAPPLYDNNRRVTDWFFSLLPTPIKTGLTKGHAGVVATQKAIEANALKSSFAVSFQRVAKNLVIAFAIVYLAVTLSEQFPNVGLAIPGIPGYVSLGVLLLFLVIWPLYRLVAELRRLVEETTAHLVRSVFPAVRRSSVILEDEVADVFTGLILFAIGLVSSVVFYHAFPDRLVFLVVPLGYSLLCLMSLSRSFYAIVEHYDALGELASDEEARRFERDDKLFLMSREFDNRSRRFRLLHAERERLREKVRAAMNTGDSVAVRSLLSHFKRREERILSGMMRGNGAARREASSKESFEDYLIRHASEFSDPPKRRVK